jgi:uncharacterized protein DUF4397
MTSIAPTTSGQAASVQPDIWLQLSGKGIARRSKPGESPHKLLKSFLLTTKRLLENLRMSRWLKAVSLTLALAALSVFATSCGSSNTQIRFVHAIQDAGALDVDVSGPNVSNTPEFTNISFLGIQPNQPGYTSIPSSTNAIEGLLTGTTTEVFSDSVGWSGGSQHTVIATGFSQTGSNGSNVVLMSITDVIPTPPTGDVSFRVIHASPSGPGAVDVYIELNPNNGPGLPITIQGLAYTQASNYVSFSFNPNNDPTPPGYTVYVTASGSMTPIISEGIYPANAGAVRTLVLTDVQNGTSMRPLFLELSDAD